MNPERNVDIMVTAGGVVLASGRVGEMMSSRGSRFCPMATRGAPSSIQPQTRMSTSHLKILSILDSGEARYLERGLESGRGAGWDVAGDRFSAQRVRNLKGAVQIGGTD